MINIREIPVEAQNFAPLQGFLYSTVTDFAKFLG